PVAVGFIGEESIGIVIKGVTEIPMVYLPAFSKINEGEKEQLVLLHTFMIPFFGKNMEDGKIVFSDNNIFKDRILKPFFESLISGLRAAQVESPDEYETLRSVLLTGTCIRM